MSAPVDFAALAAAIPAGPGVVHVRPGPITEVVLDDPTARNALTPTMMLGLRAAADAAREAQARVIVLRGAHGAFCSGGNLDAVRAHLLHDGAGRALGAYMHETVRRLADTDALLLGVLEGAAIGGGAELLAACDRVWAAPDARVGWTQARLGVSPGFGGGARLVRRVGAARALELLVSARLVPAEEAARLGLVDVLDDDPVGAATRWAEAACALPPEALRGAKAVVRGALPEEAVFAREQEVFAALWGAPDHVARVAAAARRPPPP